MNEKLKKLQSFLQAKQVPITVGELGEIINFIESIKEPEKKPEASKKK